MKYPSNSICTKYTRHEAATETDMRSDTEGHVKEMFALLGNDQKNRGGRKEGRRKRSVDVDVYTVAAICVAEASFSFSC